MSKKSQPRFPIATVKTIGGSAKWLDWKAFRLEYEDSLYPFIEFGQRLEVVTASNVPWVVFERGMGYRRGCNAAAG
jgi:hypothetical protein